MSVIRRFAGEVCAHCGTSVDLPHMSEKECERALVLDLRKEDRSIKKRPAKMTIERRLKTRNAQ